ncbi:hypothetical protein RUM44_000667 [Polyplax serrata]|uniref:Uncharacterized protein n=1 Tax=Polyplax serrata TaxID=468196 RepID=A0ABR1B899_POLSC
MARVPGDSILFTGKMNVRKNLENHRNCVMKLVKDFGLGIDAYPLAYVVFKIAGGDYEVATKMILEGKLVTTDLRRKQNLKR